MKVSMQNKRGLIFVAQSKLIAFYWKTWTFHSFGQMCLFEVLCEWCSSSDAPQHTKLQPVSEAHTACVFLWDQQHSCCFFVILHLIPYTEVWKWNETAFIWGATSRDFDCLVERRVPPLIDEIYRFWKAGIEHENLYVKLPDKKSWPMRLSKASCIWRLNIGRLASTGRKKVTHLLCVGTVWCMWMKAINFWNELWIC